MWKTIQDTCYFLSFTQSHGHEIYITDFISIWYKYFSEESFLLCLKENNDILMLDDENEYIQKGLRLLSNLDSLKKCKIEKEENGQKLFISLTMKFGYPFIFECRFDKGSEELFFQKVMQPLLKTVNDLQSSQNELRLLLKRKDKEIENYKEEVGEIVYRHLKTTPYNDDEHMNKHNVYQSTYGELHIPNTIIDKQVQIPHRTTVKEEPASQIIDNIEIKQEPVSQPLEVATSHIHMSCKQEIKTEQKASPSKQKRMKLNF